MDDELKKDHLDAVKETPVGTVVEEKERGKNMSVRAHQAFSTPGS